MVVPISLRACELLLTRWCHFYGRKVKFLFIVFSLFGGFFFAFRPFEREMKKKFMVYDSDTHMTNCCLNFDDAFPLLPSNTKPFMQLSWQ